MVRCETTKGDFTIEMHREWAPVGHDRFIELVNDHFFDDQILYRTIPGFLVQFGVASDPAVQAKWSSRIPDDPDLKIPFELGTLSFAGAGPNSRSCHMFIAMEPSGRGLGGALHERPIGKIVKRKEAKVVEKFYSGYGDLTFLQGQIASRGNIAAVDYPLLDRIKTCTVLPSEPPKDAAQGRAELSVAATPPAAQPLSTEGGESDAQQLVKDEMSVRIVPEKENLGSGETFNVMGVVAVFLMLAVVVIVAISRRSPPANRDRSV
eukprot:JP446550.1.p1 GENE.JP446550.1~~JP446550.1.p1  ORF type:complete len:294 (-),score=38.94 JP446550.1:135-926(-)